MSDIKALIQPNSRRAKSKPGFLNSAGKILRQQWTLYLMVLPGVVFFILFKYVPLFGSVMAFQDYRITRGIFGSEWVGFKHFIQFFTYYDLQRVFWNTLVLAGLSLIFSFPAPILLAFLFNEIKNRYFKKAIQTLSYLPHFFSWVVIAGLTFDVLSQNGIVNSLRLLMGMDRVLFMQKEAYFRGIIVVTSLWKEVGWGSIIILAAISNINPELYEAATVDGAGKFRQAVSITFPLLLPTIVILFLLRMGNFLELNFDQIVNLLTPMTFSVGDVLETFVYRIGVQGGQYSLTTAIGLFQSVIGFILLVIFNKLSKMYSGGGVW